MIELKVINKSDPLKRSAEKDSGMDEFSPMDPPDAYAPPNLEEVAYEDLHPILQELIDEHKVVSDKLEGIRRNLDQFAKGGPINKSGIW